MLFETLDDANRRLASTVIRFDGKPVYVLRIRESCDIEMFDMLSQKNIVGHYTKQEKLIDIHPVTLGYVNIGGCAIYTWRMPSRRSKQGLHQESLHMHKNIGADVLASLALAKTIINNFPTIEDCVDLLTTKAVEEIAFHRKFALYRSRNTFGIRYKGDKLIGYLGKDNIIRMSPGMGYLDSLLREVVDYERYKIISAE